MKTTRGRIVIGAILAYAVVFVVLGIAVDRAFYIPLVAVAFIRPLLRESGLLSDRDERQISVSHRSSHIAFLLTMALVAMLFIKKTVVDLEEPGLLLSLLLFVPLLVKFAAWQFTSRGRRRAALGIGFAIGGFWLLFSMLAGDFNPQLLVGGLPLVASLLALRWERAGGAIMFGLGVFAIYFFGEMSLIVVLLLPTPLILAGTMLLAGGGRDQDEDQSEEEEACEPQP
ncbi:MAG: hypothetical protein GF400_04190 [Candidatus Eisenbacteria bacterium]|nr:hypothetical protein [Candidatus Eisenbacteria bacterium]